MPNDKMIRGVIELRAADTPDTSKMVIEGKAISFNSPTLIYKDEDGTEYFEQIDAHALDHADMTDTCLRYNHASVIPVLARIRGGSLTIEIRADGVYFRAELFNTSAARDCYELVKQGALQCSFAFIVSPEGGAEYDRMTHTHTIKRIDRLIDLSIVDIPAYKDTFVQARSQIELESAELERLESLRRRREIIAKTI